MWQRFKERSRRVVFFAQEEATNRGDLHVDTQHLLLGIVREEVNMASQVLRSLGISALQVREAVERHLTPGEAGRLGQDMQLTPQAMRAIDLAKDESLQMSDTAIGTEHLLLGLIQESEGLAGRVLAELGIELEKTRHEVQKTSIGGPQESTPPPKIRETPFRGLLESTPALMDVEAELMRLERFVVDASSATSEDAYLETLKRKLTELHENLTGAAANPPPPKSENKRKLNRFTVRAQRTVLFAQEEAKRLGESEVETEHLLLALIRESDSIAVRLLDRMGIEIKAIRTLLEQTIEPAQSPTDQDVELSANLKKVLDIVSDEADQLGNNYIGTEHLLLGLIRDVEGAAGLILAMVGADLNRTRKEILALQDNDSGTTHPGNEPPKKGRTTDAAPAKEDPTPIEQVVRASIAEDPAGWRGRSLVSLFDVSPEQVKAVLDLAIRLKALRAGERFLYFSHPKTMALLFEKPSLRTRVSFEAGMAHLAGHAIYLAPADVGLGVRESVADVAGGLSRWVDIIAARTFKHETVEELAANAVIPVINALSDREHPIQAFADLLTMMELKGALGNRLKLAYIGDGNNVLHALLLACAKVGVNLTAACPQGYEPNAEYVEEAQHIGSGEYGTGAHIEIVTDPIAAVQEADVVYTDVWPSMGQEEEKAERLKIFAPYQINAALLAHATSDVIVLHCLPAHREEEVTSEVMDAYKTVIQDQAENRLHTQKALVALMLGL